MKSENELLQEQIQILQKQIDLQSGQIKILLQMINDIWGFIIKC